MNFFKYFPEGQEISAFTKDNRIFEGTVYNRSDGVKVVLNNNTRKWIKLTELNNIKLTGEHLYEDSVEEFKEILSTTAPELDPDKIKGKEKQVKDALITTTNNELEINNKPKVSLEDAEKLVDESLIAAQAKANANKTGGDAQKAQSFLDEFQKEKTELKEEINKNIKKDYNKLHPSLKVLLESDDFEDEGLDEEDLEEFRNESFSEEPEENESDVELSDEEEDEIQSKAIEIEKEDYSNISNEEKEELIGEIVSQIDDHLDDLENYIKTQYEVTETEAENYAIEALEIYLGNKESEESIKDTNEEIDNENKEDDLEKEFENAIDEIDTNDDVVVLDHIVDKFEIDPDEAEKIVESCKYNFINSVMALLEHVRKIREKSVKVANVITAVDENGKEVKNWSANDDLTTKQGINFVKRQHGRKLISESKCGLPEDFYNWNYKDQMKFLENDEKRLKKINSDFDKEMRELDKTAPLGEAAPRQIVAVEANKEKVKAFAPEDVSSENVQIRFLKGLPGRELIAEAKTGIKTYKRNSKIKDSN